MIDGVQSKVPRNRIKGKWIRLINVYQVRQKSTWSLFVYPLVWGLRGVSAKSDSACVSVTMGGEIGTQSLETGGLTGKDITFPCPKGPS